MTRTLRAPAARALTALLLAAAPALAQSPVPSAAEALAECVAAVRSGPPEAARDAATRAEARARAELTAHPDDPDAYVRVARVLAQCRLPQAAVLSRPRLIARANRLLEQALAIDGTHWTARFSLAVNHFHTPQFLGRTDDAIREFEQLLANQGDRSHPPAFADTYQYLGDLYRRTGRHPEALALWRRGSALFPDHAGLRERAGTGDPDPLADGRHADGPDEADPRPRYALAELVVAAGGTRLDDPRSGVALRRVDVLTTPGGAADLMQALRTAPGVTAATEGADLYVRGGDPAESPVWVDGARIFYPGRYETLNGSVFGILDPAVLQGAYFSSGGFSARYGNALSGVLDVETEGRPAEPAGHVALNSVQAGGSARLPLGDAAGAWASVRATDATAMLALHGRGDEFARAPRALEGIAGAAWEPRPGARLRATALIDEDRSAREVEAYGHRGAFESRGENRLLGLGGRWVGGGGRAGVRGSVSMSSRSSAFRFGVLDQERTDRGGYGRLDADLELSGAGRLRAGLEAASLRARWGGALPAGDRLDPGSEVEHGTHAASASHLGGYLEAEATPLPVLAVIAGLRADRLPGENAWSADPRVAVGIRPAERWTVRLGAGVFRQGRWRSGYRLPDDRSPHGVPRRAVHRSVGVERQAEPALRMEAYVKDYDAYVHEDGIRGPRTVEARATGADAVVRWSRQDRLNGWITYSLLRGRLRLEDDQEAPSALDVTHSLTAVGMLRLSDGWQLGGTARHATGRPFTRPGGEPNAERLPDYARLDARLTRFWSLGAGGTLVGYLELLNALDRTNVSAYSFDASGNEQPIAAFFRRTAVLGASLSF